MTSLSKPPTKRKITLYRASRKFPHPPVWSDQGCDVFWHDGGISLLIPIFQGKRRVLICLDCLVALFEEGKSRNQIILELEEWAEQS
jgi:hypothetical protein